MYFGDGGIPFGVYLAVVGRILVPILLFDGYFGCFYGCYACDSCVFGCDSSLYLPVLFVALCVFYCFVWNLFLHFWKSF